MCGVPRAEVPQDAPKRRGGGAWSFHGRTAAVQELRAPAVSLLFPHCSQKAACQVLRLMGISCVSRVKEAGQRPVAEGASGSCGDIRPVLATGGLSRTRSLRCAVPPARAAAGRMRARSRRLTSGADGAAEAGLERDLTELGVWIRSCSRAQSPAGVGR